MTITTLDVRDEYTAAAGQTVFNYTFKIYASTDLNVYVTPGGDDANDSTDLVVGYSVAGVGNENGGAITLVAPTALGDKVTIVSNIPSNRTTDYQNNGDFLPDTVNDDFDRVVSLVKQVEDLASRTALLQQSQQGSKPFSLPVPSPGDYLIWNATGDGFVNISSQNTVDALQADPGNEITVNDAGFDCDFRVESTTDQYAIFLDASTGNMTFNNGFQLLALSDSETVFNESGQDVDFRIESSINANAFILDGAYCAVGIGATIEDWSSFQSVIQIGGNAAIASEITPAAGNGINIFQNAYINAAGSYRYQDDDESSRIRLIEGIVQHFSAALGTGDNPITWVETFRSGVSEVVVNDTSQDMDFRVESNARTHAFFVEGLNSNIGFGMSTFSGTGVLAIAEGIAPSSDPVNGGYLYVDQADEFLKFRDTNSIITQIAPFIGTNVGDIVFNESGGNYDFRIESDVDTNAFVIDGGTGVISFSNVNDLLSFDASETVFNDDQADIDFRIETQINASAFIIDSGTGNISFNATYPMLLLSETDSEAVFNNGQQDRDFRVESNVDTHALWIKGADSSINFSTNIDYGWNANYVAVQFGPNFNVLAYATESPTANSSISQNIYYDTSFRYIANGLGTRVAQNDQGWAFQVANVSGLADAIIPGFNTLLNLNNTDTIFNNNGSDIDFRVETSLDANAFTIDGGTGVISFSNTNDLLSFDAAETVFNDSGADIDFRIESDTNANAFFLDGGNSNAAFNGIPTDSSTRLEIHHTGSGNVVYNDSTRRVFFGSDSTGGLFGTLNNYNVNIISNSIRIARFDTRGNLGLGVDPITTWDGAYNVFQIGGIGSIFSHETPAATNSIYIANNSYYQAGWRYHIDGETTHYRQSQGDHLFYAAIAGTAGTIAVYNEILKLNISETVFNEDGADIDFRVESDTITNAIFMDGATGIVSLPACYSHDMNGETYRDLLINDSGELGYDSSTIRKKTNINDMENVDWLYDLRPVNFEYRKRDANGTYLNEGTGKMKYGLIAEELERVNSDFVFYDDEDRPEGIQYREFVPVLIKALQDQQIEIENLKRRVYA